eukprot:gene9771-7651_t
MQLMCDYSADSTVDNSSFYMCTTSAKKVTSDKKQQASCATRYKVRKLVQWPTAASCGTTSAKFSDKQSSFIVTTRRKSKVDNRAASCATTVQRVTGQTGKLHVALQCPPKYSGNSSFMCTTSAKYSGNSSFMCTTSAKYSDNSSFMCTTSAKYSDNSSFMCTTRAKYSDNSSFMCYNVRSK